MKAILDLGTNTFHLLIAELVDGKIKEVYQEQIPVKIGEGGINKGMLAPEAYLRGIKALQKFHVILSRFPISSITATGTSAIRHAQNGSAFLTEAKNLFGFDIQSISGDLEAGLIYQGVQQSFPFPDEPVLVMDIGGGSVEFIIGHRENIIWKQSFEIGAARLLAQFEPSNPIRPQEINALENYLRQSLRPLEKAIQLTRDKGNLLNTVIGSAGSFETILEIILLDMKGNYSSITPFAHVISEIHLTHFYNIVIPSTKEERENLKGLVDFRVDMIVSAALIIRFVMKEFGLQKMICSNYALKEGLLFHSF